MTKEYILKTKQLFKKLNFYHMRKPDEEKIVFLTVRIRNKYLI